MKKMIPTKERIFISLVGTSGSRKFHPNSACLKFGTSQPAFDNFCYFINIINLLIVKCKEINLKFVQGIDLDLIANLPNNGFKYPLIFDDSCEEVSNSKQFVRTATAGRHSSLKTTYIKHN